jgi:lactate permease
VIKLVRSTEQPNVYNFSGMAASLASAFSKIGVAFILAAPVLGWIGVALSGSNTSSNAMNTVR